MTLDDILSLLNRTTRRNFQAWMQYQAAAIAGRGEQLNASLATFEPFVEHGNTAASTSSPPRKGPCGRWCTTRASCSTRWPGATTSSKG